MQRAKTLSANMMKNVRSNEAVERASKNAAMEQTAREKQQLRDSVFAKAAAHGDVIGTSSKCMRDIEDGVLQTENSLALLRQNRALGFAALQVCRRRIQLRDRRPPAELVKDYVAIALDSEKKLLETAREDFLQMEQEGKKIVEDLSSMRAFLSADTGTRRLVMKKDQQTLRPHMQPPIELQRPAPEVKEADSRSLLEDSFTLVDRSNKHREKSLAHVARIKHDSQMAVTRTEDCLEKRADELTVLERELRQSQTDTDNAISVAERSLDKSTKRLDPTDLGKKEKLIRDKALLDQLKAHKATLHCDIHNKFIALEIDNMCRRVTPIKACEPNLLDSQNANQKSNHPASAGLASSASAPSLLSTAGSNMGMTSAKLPNLPGTMDSFAREKFGGTSQKFSSKAASNSTPSSASSTGMMKVSR
jgi:hypothetical protein